ncbi:Ligand-gated ion channel [Nesidiocoris tenuis]|uniref:Ligand-gated ion channel n=1 Tax=Nesidiocoris tenuis TaxID=355587 RepID=A0ABN7B9M7_9HEMI|nr:Ligand-gated ion channel [Nesidiocoris tenuis]
MKPLPIGGISTVFLLLILKNALIKCTWSPNLISNYFHLKNVFFVDAIVCSSDDGVAIFNHFNEHVKNYGFFAFFRIVSNLDNVEIDDNVRTGIFIDVQCSQNQNLLIGSRWFTNTFSWLIWDPDSIVNTSNFAWPIALFSDVVFVNSESLVQLYKATPDIPVTTIDVGRWDRATDEVDYNFREKRINLRKNPVTAAMMFIQDVYDRPNVTLQLQDSSYFPDVDVSNRFTFCNALHVGYLFNFTLAVVVTNTWGDRLENGTWTGMMGLVQTGQADIALTPMLPFSLRMDVSYPSVPNLLYWMAVIFKQQRALGTYKAMILELSPATWAAVGCLTIIGAVVFAITQRSFLSEDETLDSSVPMGLLQTVGIIANQGLTLMPVRTSSRIVCFSLLTVGLLISTYYNAATMTALLSEAPPLIKDLNQLVSSNIPFSAVNAPYVHNRNARGRVFRQQVVHRMDKNLQVCDLDDGIQTILNGSAYLGEYFVLFKGITSQLKSDEICDLTIFNAGFYTVTLNYLRKCQHFREMFIRGTLRTMEHGLQQKERRRWIAGRPVCSRIVQFIHVRMEAAIPPKITKQAKLRETPVL